VAQIPSAKGQKAAQKKEARRAASRRRERLVQHADASTFEGLSRTVLSIIEARGGKETIAAYWPLGTEADIRVLLSDLQRAGYPIALPRMVAKDQPLEFRLFESGDPLSPGPHNVREPSPKAPLARPEVVLVPGLAFDSAGYRIGYGAGYYDRTLEALRAKGSLLAIGIAYAGQMVDRISAEDHDQPLDLIATEEGIRLPLRHSVGGA
jgi:5-formyltetrahydrofolate cyclo-ligase